MYQELAAGLAGLKTVSDLVTLALKIKEDTALTAKAIESQSAIIALNTTILGVQASNQELLEENQRLKKEIVDLKNWDEEASRYQLSQVGQYEGSVAYVLKEEYADTAPAHKLCPNCYDEKRKSMLQPNGTRRGRILYTCARCPAEVV